MLTLQEVSYLNLSSISYTAFAIGHLSLIYPGLFQCLLVHMANPSETTTEFEQLLESISFINKYVIDKHFKVTYENLPHKPSLIVIYCDSDLSSTEMKIFSSNLRTLDSNSKVLVLVNSTKPHQMKTVIETITKNKFNFVVYLDTGTTYPKIVYANTAGSIVDRLNYYPHPEELFRDSVRDMRGNPLVYSFSQAMRLQYMNWMTVTAWYLNATVQNVISPCKRTMSALDCLIELFGSCDMDIALNEFVFIRLLPSMYRMLFNILPDAEVFLVPKGRPLNIGEMFIKPFRWEAWIILVTVLLVVEVVSLILPSLFKNDPILLLVCGFERQDLHHANTRERVIFLPLVMFFFLVMNAYETKITSYMMQVPSVADIQTIQELVRSGMKIKVNLQNNRKILKDELLGPIVVNGSGNLLQLDGVHAYLGDISSAQHVIRMWDNYDFELERPMYNILKERRRMDLYVFWISFCTPLYEALYFTQKMMFEAGLWTLWIRLDWESRDAKQKRSMRNAVVDLGQRLLTFEDVLPAWIALSMGCVASGVLLVVELGVFALVKKAYHNKVI